MSKYEKVDDIDLDDKEKGIVPDLPKAVPVKQSTIVFWFGTNIITSITIVIINKWQAYLNSS